MTNPDPDNPVKLGRRQSLQLGAASAALGLLAFDAATPAAQAQDGGGTKVPRSPAWPPFMDALPVDPPPAPLPALYPPDQLEPQPQEAGRQAHQHYEKFTVAARYALRAQEATHQFHSQGPKNQTVWGFNGRFHGPTIEARYGKPVVVRF
jgi:FtsP/CotA-like multicopper oxidase with cupredoxin domain